MKLNELEINKGSLTSRKRVGRGPGSGLGKTSGRGQKGQKARSGVKISASFEGGQLPLYRRLPKRGFKNALFKKEYAVVNLDKLNLLDEGTVVTPALLIDKGIIKKEKDGIKVLSKGELTKKLTFKGVKFSNKALDKVKASGSQIEVL